MARAVRIELRSAALLVAVAALGLLSASAAPERARAAPCPVPGYGLAAGELSIQGTPPCEAEPESYKVFCSAGSVAFDYLVNGVLQGTTGTGVPCSAPSHLRLLGLGGDDELDLSQVAAGLGFTGITQPNLIEGGSGSDLVRGSALSDSVLGGSGSEVLLLRDGKSDTADCGDGIDALQGDQPGTDSASGCEVLDLLPASKPKPACKKKRKRAAVAAKRCKKKKRGKKR